MFDDELQRYEGMMDEEQAEKIELTLEQEKEEAAFARADRARLRKERVGRLQRARQILAQLPPSPNVEEDVEKSGKRYRTALKARDKRTRKAKSATKPNSSSSHHTSGRRRRKSEKP
jgi:hypothetical protein